LPFVCIEERNSTVKSSQQFLDWSLAARTFRSIHRVRSTSPKNMAPTGGGTELRYNGGITQRDGTLKCHMPA